MTFASLLSNQLRATIGKTVEIATDNVLFEGVLVKFEEDIIELEETVIGYERESRFVSIALSSVNFIRVESYSL